MTDLIDYRPDGSVKIRLGEEQVRLRRPTMGELEDLQYAVTDAPDDIADIIDDYKEKVAAAAEEAGVTVRTDPLESAAARMLGAWSQIVERWDPAVAQERTEQVQAWLTELEVDVDGEDDAEEPREWKRTRRHIMRDRGVDIRKVWTSIGRDLFEALSPPRHTLPEDDRALDPALGSANLYLALLAHWLHVPLPSGAADETAPNRPSK